MSKSFLTLVLCFGLGLGLAPLVRPAHACSCAVHSYWNLELERIAGDGDIAVEQAFWTESASLTEGLGSDHVTLSLDGITTLRLERLP